MAQGTATTTELEIFRRHAEVLHVLSNPVRHEKAKVHIHLEHKAITIIGFYSDNHRGIFTPRDHAIHQHLVAADGKISGHVEKLSLSSSTTLFLPVP